MIKLPVLRAAALVVATASFAWLPHPAKAAATMTFYGITLHVSTDNIKVEDPRTKHVMSFLIVPKFDRVFSGDGKTTYQMRRIKAGQYVGIIYDRKALGIVHADKIFLLNNANQRIAAPQ